jgi:hypothetical protein
MTNEVRIALCEHKKKHPSLTQADLITWLQETHNVSVSQGTISLTLKHSAEILAKKGGCEPNGKAAADREVPTDGDNSVPVVLHIPRPSQYVR